MVGSLAFFVFLLIFIWTRLSYRATNWQAVLAAACWIMEGHRRANTGLNPVVRVSNHKQNRTNPDVWIDGGLVLDAASSSVSGFYAHFSDQDWRSRGWGHLDELGLGGSVGDSCTGFVLCT